MTIELIDVEGLARPVGYRHVSRAHGRVTVQLAGQVGVDGEGQTVGDPGDYAAQAEKALENAVTAFAAAGATAQDIAELTYYVVGLDEVRAEQVNRGLGRTVRRLKVPPVPATMVGITGLMRGDLLIEVNGSAVID